MGKSCHVTPKGYLLPYNVPRKKSNMKTHQMLFYTEQLHILQILPRTKFRHRSFSRNRGKISLPLRIAEIFYVFNKISSLVTICRLTEDLLRIIIITIIIVITSRTRVIPRTFKDFWKVYYLCSFCEGQAKFGQRASHPLGKTVLHICSDVDPSRSPCLKIINRKSFERGIFWSNILCC